jgi:AmmeMemoRadiSam system protein A
MSMELTADQRRSLLDIARQTIRAALRAEECAASECSACFTDPVLRQPAGCFVTLHTLGEHRLRGCVGKLDSRDELIEAVRQSAQSVLQDPRFVTSPVVSDELPGLELEITVIFPLRPATSCVDFDPEIDGIYLTINDRSGCFLPQVARETGWGREQLLERLCSEKLGLARTAWRDSGASARLMKFHTLIIGPEPFEPLRDASATTLSSPLAAVEPGQQEATIH